MRKDVGYEAQYDLQFASSAYRALCRFEYLGIKRYS